MALWGNNDNISSEGLAWLDPSTGIVTATGSNFGEVGFAKTGDVIRFLSDAGEAVAGDAVIVGIASTTQLTIGSTSKVIYPADGWPVEGVEYYISELPSYVTEDTSYGVSGITDSAAPTFSNVSGISTAMMEAYASESGGLMHTSHAGWVQYTLIPSSEEEGFPFRIKSEVLVAGSGIQTGTDSLPFAFFG